MQENQIKNEINKAFGTVDLPHGLFYEFEIALRFELGGEQYGMDRPIRRFMQAHQRAMDIAKFLFPEPSNLSIMISSYGDNNGIDTDFSRLKLCFPEINKNKFSYRSVDDPDYDPNIYRYWHCMQVKDELTLDELLWLDIASEMPIGPCSIDHQSYLVDLERAIIFHAYDDRGLDIVAMKRETLQPLYDQFSKWLLDYDIKRMKSIFE